MDRYTLSVPIDLWLILVAAICGWRFLTTKKNALLGLEWLVVAISATNFLIFHLTSWPIAATVTFYLDAFSRSMGFTIISIVGLLVITHRYKPSLVVDIGLFGSAAVAGLILFLIHRDPNQPDILQDRIYLLKILIFVMSWTVLSTFLVYFAWRLFKAGEKLHAWLILSAMVTSQAVAIVYDFFPIPGDDPDMTLFFNIAIAVWGWTLLEIYLAYGAFERATGTRPRAPEALHQPAG